MDEPDRRRDDRRSRRRLDDVLEQSQAVASRLEDAADRLEAAVDRLDRRHNGRRHRDSGDSP